MEIGPKGYNLAGILACSTPTHVLTPKSDPTVPTLPWVKLCVCGTEFNRPAFSDQLPRNGVPPPGHAPAQPGKTRFKLSNIGLGSLVLWVLCGLFSGGKDLRTPYHRPYVKIFADLYPFLLKDFIHKCCRCCIEVVGSGKYPLWVKLKRTPIPNQVVQS